MHIEIADRKIIAVLSVLLILTAGAYAAEVTGFFAEPEILDMGTITLTQNPAAVNSIQGIQVGNGYILKDYNALFYDINITYTYGGVQHTNESFLMGFEMPPTDYSVSKEGNIILTPEAKSRVISEFTQYLNELKNRIENTAPPEKTEIPTTAEVDITGG